MKKSLLLILICCFSFISAPCFSATSTYALSDAGMQYALTLCGTSYQVKGNSVYILVDQDAVFNQLDRQIKRNWYTYKKNYLINNPAMTSLFSGLYSTESIIPRVYQDNPKLNYVHVYISFKHDNSLGNSVVNSLCSFDMYRNLSNKINWTRFWLKNAIKVYPNFKISTYMNRLYQPRQNPNTQDYYLAEKARRLYLQNLVRSEEQFAKIQQENGY